MIDDRWFGRTARELKLLAFTDGYSFSSSTFALITSFDDLKTHPWLIFPKIWPKLGYFTKRSREKTQKENVTAHGRRKLKKAAFHRFFSLWVSQSNSCERRILKQFELPSCHFRQPLHEVEPANNLFAYYLFSFCTRHIKKGNSTHNFENTWLVNDKFESLWVYMSPSVLSLKIHELFSWKPQYCCNVGVRQRQEGKIVNSTTFRSTKTFSFDESVEPRTSQLAVHLFNQWPRAPDLFEYFL